MQKIKFTPLSKFADSFLNPPRPASQFLPEWYKGMPNFSDNALTFGIHESSSFGSNTTVKHCSPFLDGLTFGYIWSLPVDVQVTVLDGIFHFKWRTEGDFVTSHSPDQHPGLPAVQDGESFVLKWSFLFNISTPKGYSTLFTHPLNRHDLPFRTFSGVVETDRYPLAVQFPFQFISKDFDESLIIPKGTPLVQIIPFKRDSWTSEEGEYVEGDADKRDFFFKSNIVKSYKRNFWTKKIFK